MEVRIKQGNEMLDATIEMVDGVMVVSPKVEKFEPKDGDVVYQDGNPQWVFIYMDCLTPEAHEYVALNLFTDRLSFPNGAHIGYVNTLRPATEEEKQNLFDKLKEKGYEWDAEKKELLKLKWEPRLGDKYWKVRCTNFTFRPDELTWENFTFEKEAYNKGLVFKTEEECQELCDRLNETINSVKP